MTEPRRSANNGTVWAGMGIVVSTAAVLLTNFILVSKTPTKLFADTAVLTVAVLILGTVFRLGADRIFIGEVQASKDRGAGLLAFSLLVGVLGGGVAASEPIANLLDRALSVDLTGTERVLVAVWLASDTSRLVVAEAHRSVDRVRMAAVAGTGLRSPLYLALVLGLISAGDPLRRQDLLLVGALASAIVLATALATVASSYPWWQANPFTSTRVLWRGHGSMLATTAAATIIGAADVYVVGASIGSEQAARYAFAVSLVGGIAIVDTAISLGISPSVARGLEPENRRTTERLVVRLTRIASGLAALLYVGLLLLSERFAVSLGGGEYKGVRPLVAMLGAGQLLGVMFGPGGSLLIIARQYSSITAVTVCVSLVMVAVTSAAGFLAGSLLLLAAASGAATAALHALGAVACRRRLGMTVHVLGPGEHS